MTTPKRPPISSENPTATGPGPRPFAPDGGRDRPQPEFSTERDALNMVRSRRPKIGTTAGGIMSVFPLTLPVKIGLVALLVSAGVIGFWMMKSPSTPATGSTLPVIAPSQEVIDFKAAPTSKDAVQIPHSDKEFYSELDASKTGQNQEAMRAIPERPESQISQEALFVDGNPLPGVQDTSSNVTPLATAPLMVQKSMPSQPKSLQGDEMLTAADAPLDDGDGASDGTSVTPPESVMPEPDTGGSEDTSNPNEDIRVVENASDSPTQAYASPAPSAYQGKPRKTLEMAIHETERAVSQQAREFEKQDNVGKKDVGVDLTASGVPHRQLRIISQKEKAQKAEAAFQNVEAVESSEGATNDVVKAEPEKGSIEVEPKAASVQPSPKADTPKSTPSPQKGKGNYWLQLASVASEKTAQSEGKRLQAKAGGELQSARLKTVRVDLGKPKGIRHRVHFGPYSREEAIQKCEALKNKSNMTCLVVKG